MNVSEEIELVSPCVMEPADVTLQKQKEAKSLERWGRCIIIVTILFIFSLGLIAGGVAHNEYQKRTTRPPSDAEFVALGGIAASLNGTESACTKFGAFAGHQLPTGYTLRDTVLEGAAAQFVSGYWNLPRGHAAYVELISPSTALREGLAVNGVRAAKTMYGKVELGVSSAVNTSTEILLACGECAGAGNESASNVPTGLAPGCFLYARQLLRDAERCSCCDTGKTCTSSLPPAVLKNPEATCKAFPLRASDATEAANDRSIELIYHTKLMTHSDAVKTAVRAWPSDYKDLEGDRKAYNNAIQCFRTVANITVQSEWTTGGLPSVSDSALKKATTFDDMVVAADAEYHSAKFDNPRTFGSWPISPTADTVSSENGIHFVPNTYRWAFSNLRAYGLGRLVGALAHSAAKTFEGPCLSGPRSSAASYIVDEFQYQCSKEMSEAAEATPQKWLDTFEMSGVTLTAEMLFHLGAAREIGPKNMLRGSAFVRAFGCRSSQMQKNPCTSVP